MAFDFFEHNTTLVPAWYGMINKQRARAAVMLSFKEDGECLLLASPNLTKENIIALVRDTLLQMEAGNSSQIIKP